LAGGLALLQVYESFNYPLAHLYIPV